MIPSKHIVKKLKLLDRNLSVEWNNVNKYWEIYCSMPSGKRLITPVVDGIYVMGGGCTFVPLDERIVEWVYSADPSRVDKKWRWAAKKKYYDRINRQNVKFKQTAQHTSQQFYNILHNSKPSSYLETSNWLRPDVQTKSRSRIMQRSAENARRFFGDSN